MKKLAKQQFIENSEANSLHGIERQNWTDDEIKEMMANDKLVTGGFFSYKSFARLVLARKFLDFE